MSRPYRATTGVRRATPEEEQEINTRKRPRPGDVLVGERVITLPGSGGGWITVQLWGANVLELGPEDRAFVEELAALLDRHTDRLANRDQHTE